MSFTTRPTLRGYGGAVTSGHYLASWIGARILAEGGNACDAACGVGFALQVLEPHVNGPAGEVPILVHVVAEDRVYAISGQGVAPAAASIDAMRARGVDLIPGNGVMAATVPAALDAWCLLLEHFGTRSLEQVLGPALALARDGFPMYGALHRVLGLLEPRFQTEWPTSGALYLPRRRLGERQTNPALADVWDELLRVERAAAGGREAKIRAARDAFYQGRPAERIGEFVQKPLRDQSGREQTGFLTADDLARYRGRVEEPVSAVYRGARVWKCGPWTQGPVFLQQLRLLEGFDLGAMGHNSVDALHTWLECAKLAYADREACYGDPEFAEVPLDELLSDAYTEKRRSLVDPERASLELRPGLGRLPAGWPLLRREPAAPAEPLALETSRGKGDTTHLDVVDRHGNAVAATPSGAWLPSSPVIPELGFPIGTRAQMFCLDPEHPNALVPGKRPRTTLTPSLALLGDGRRMAFGTEGGDQQDQWTLQFLLNVLDFGFEDLQAAIDAPTLHSTHFPLSFWPRTSAPGEVMAESRVPAAVIAALEARGHRVQLGGDWRNGRVMTVTHHPETGAIEAAASPRSIDAYAVVLP